MKQKNLCSASVQFSHSVVSDALWPHELQHARPPCPSPTLRVYSNSCPSSWWCHPAISSSVVPFSSCPQALPASWFFPMSQLFAWGGKSIGVSASASVLPMNTQDWSSSGWTGLISTQCFVPNIFPRNETCDCSYHHWWIDTYRTLYPLSFFLQKLHKLYNVKHKMEIILVILVMIFICLKCL